MKEGFLSRVFSEKLENLTSQLEHILIGKPDVVVRVLTTLLAEGHLLIEDVPGVGKTSLANGIASSLNLQFRRIQFTNDLLPGDITGSSIYDREKGSFSFHPGPLFTHILLADEVNRGTPKTQSALLEAMSERQVSCDGEIHQLPHPFMVIATQNPFEHAGTYPLPDSQLDRFLMRISIGYPEREDELRILERGGAGRKKCTVLLEKDDVLTLQQKVKEVWVEPVLKEYLLEIVSATRESSALTLGVSPRGSLGFLRAVQAFALLQGRGFVLPDDLQLLAPDVLAHRVTPSAAGEGGENGRKIIEEIVSSLPVPR